MTESEVESGAGPASDTPEQDLAGRLAGFDEALRAGEDVTLHGAGEVGRAQACLRLLEEFWPRHPNNAPSLLRATLPAPAGTPAALPATVGRFRVVRELGRGGFGIVYLARDPLLGREVAVKVPRAEALASPDLRRRFRQEALAAAALDHPNLVPVYETGEAGPLCWIVSAYCPGVNLADWLRGRKEAVPVGDAARLVATLAAAVQHAHDRGVVHRDLKPANILLVDEADGRREPAGAAADGADADPPGAGLPAGSRRPFAQTPKITDFGLAKLLDEDAATHTGATVGTPAYMAPEQAGGAAPVGAAADVYALGVILYELLTGRVPFVAGSAVEMMLLARTEEPVPPGRLRHRLPRDLETICLKCLEKEPGRRYPSAAALAADLNRFLAGEPIVARPLGLGGRGWRWCRRNPRVAGLLLALGVVVAAGAGGVGWQWWRAERNADQAGKDRDDAQDARRRAADALDRHRIMRAFDEWQADNAQAARELLDDAAARKGSWEWRYVDRLLRRGRYEFAEHTAAIEGAAFTPDGRRLVSVGRDGAVFVRDLAAGTADEFSVLPGGAGEARGVALDPRGGRHLAVGTAAGQITVWNLDDRRPVAAWPAHPPGDTFRLAYSPDGRRLASAMGSTVRVWDPARGIGGGSFRHAGPVLGLAWSPDGRFLAACANGPREVRVWELATGTMTAIPTLRWMATAVAFSPDGKRLAWAGMDGVVVLHDVAPGFPKSGSLSGSPGYQSSLRFSPDGRLVAAGGANGPARVWDVETGRLAETLHGHSRGVRGLAFGPDGSYLATVGGDHRVVVWDILDPQEVITLTDFTPGRFMGAAFDPGGRRMATAVRSFRLWDLDRQAAAATVPAVDGLGVAFHPSGGVFAGGDVTGTVRVVDGAGGVVASRTAAGWPLAVQYADGGRRLLVAGWDNAVSAWDTTGHDPPAVLAGPLGRADRAGLKWWDCAAAFAPDGSAVAYAEPDRPPAVWDLRTGQKTATLDGGQAATTAVAFDPAGRRVAVGGNRGEVQVWDAGTGRLVTRLPGHPNRVFGLAYTPDGSRLASVAGDGVVKLWEVEAGAEVLALRGHATFDTGLSFSPDGESLVAGGWDGFLRVWTVRDPRAESPAARLERRRAWHRWNADEAAKERRWFAARVHLDQLVRLDPGRGSLRRERAKVLAELGDAAGAAADSAAAAELPD